MAHHEETPQGDRLTQLVDRAAITDVFHTYAFRFDRNEPEQVGRLFEGNAIIDYGPGMATIYGRDALVETITVGLRELFAATSHHISNVAVEFEANNSARAVAYLHAWHRYRDGSPDGYLWGQYHTRLRRANDGWKFTHMTLKVAGAVDFHRDSMHPIGRRPSD